MTKQQEKVERSYISQIQFNSNECLEIQEDDIIILVGPNNVGKSQALRDICNLSYNGLGGRVVSKIKITKQDISFINVAHRINRGILINDSPNNDILKSTIVTCDGMDEYFLNEPYYGEYRDVFLINVDTKARLTICIPPEYIPRNAPRTHPIHCAAFNRTYRKWLSNNFKKAFDKEIIPNTQFGAVIPLCIGPVIKFEENFEDEQERQEKYASILETYEQLQTQGDGIKSFTGILLYLMLDYCHTYLIDEPEAFLHPPQARIIGQIIGESLSNHQQAFISTHSEDIIKGLVDACPERIRIIRITRKENENFFSILNNKDFNEIWKDPLLKYSNIMSSLFHKTVVLCESDADCKMYSIIEKHIKQSNEKYSDTLFIHCGGKQRMSKVVKALKSLNIEVKLIPDIDIMNDENVFKELIETFDIDWTLIQSSYKIVTSNLHSSKETVNREKAKLLITNILDKSNSKNLSNKELNEISSVIKVESKWNKIKEGGISAIPSGDATKAFKKINLILKDNGIYMVPVGELECFIKEVGSKYHGPEWVNKVLEEYPDLNDPIYDTIKEFIKDMNL